MTTLREAATAALEAMEREAEYFLQEHSEYNEVLLPAIEALKAALAEQVQEPVAKVELMTTGWNPGLATRIVEIDDHFRDRLRPGQLLYTSPPQRPAEPVTLDWLHKWANQDDGEPETQWHEGYEAARRVVQIHLTTPPQRKPLTREQAIALWADKSDGPSNGEIVSYCRAVEAAHGIKEGT